MPLPNGTRLGPYEIVSPIGAGGMGEVFRARDTRLDRSVALKILPTEFARDAQLKLRFEREAKVISQLTHPHICTLYDIGSAEGIEFLVMELLDGETLASRLKKGPLEMQQVLRYGIEIAEALAVAHRAGIVHRDVKPGNVMLTKSGAKLLDFGLARAASSPDTTHDESTFEQDFVTTGGVILGTPQYMSPEQLGGEELDARTDIFSFGAMLYEMATGRRAFQGSTRTSLIAAIVSSEPAPMTELQPLTPPAFEHVVKKCLAKDRDERWQSAYDVAEELRWISEAGSRAGLASPIVAQKKQRARALWAAGLLGVALATGTAAWIASARWTRTHQPEPVYRLTLSTPPGQILGFDAGSMALSPDGKQVTYSAFGKDGSLLIVRNLSETTWRTLDGTNGAYAPFWSPDGKQIGYTARGSMWKVPADGSGAPDEITRLPIPRRVTGTWNRDGVIVFSFGEKLYRVNASGGDPVQLRVFPDSATVGVPEFLPDGRHFLFVLRLTSDSVMNCVGSLDGKEPPRRIVSGSNNARYANGHLFFVKGSTLYAQRFDLEKLELRGEPHAISKVQAYIGPAYFSVAEDALVYLPLGSEVLTQLERVDRSGNVISTIGPRGFFFSPRLSRDGTRVAVDQSNSNGPGDIWLANVATGALTRLTFSPANESAPAWGPGDRELLYYMDRGDSSVLMRKHLAGGEPELFFDTIGSFTGDWSQDGKWILALTTQHRGLDPMKVIGISTSDRRTLPVGAIGLAPRLSPDGRWIAYSAYDEGTPDVFVQPFPPNGSKWQVSSGGGGMPVWSRDGKSLFFLGPNGKIMESSVAATDDGGFAARAPQPLFSTGLREGVPMFSQFDVFPDGTFLLNRVPDDATTPMTVVLHWKQALGE